MTNVHALPGVTPQALVNEEAVALLAEYLEAARSGEIVGVALVGVRADGASNPTWCCASKMGNDLFAGVATLQHMMIASRFDGE